MRNAEEERGLRRKTEKKGLGNGSERGGKRGRGDGAVDLAGDEAGEDVLVGGGVEVAVDEGVGDDAGDAGELGRVDDVASGGVDGGEGDAVPGEESAAPDGDDLALGGGVLPEDFAGGGVEGGHAFIAQVAVDDALVRGGLGGDGVSGAVAPESRTRGGEGPDGLIARGDEDALTIRDGARVDAAEDAGAADEIAAGCEDEDIATLRDGTDVWADADEIGIEGADGGKGPGRDARAHDVGGQVAGGGAEDEHAAVLHGLGVDDAFELLAGDEVAVGLGEDEALGLAGDDESLGVGGVLDHADPLGEGAGEVSGPAIAAVGGGHEGDGTAGLLRDDDVAGGEDVDDARAAGGAHEGEADPVEAVAELGPVRMDDGEGRGAGASGGG